MSTVAIREERETAFAEDFKPPRRIASYELWAFHMPERSIHPHENRDDERTATFVAAETREEALALAPSAPPGCQWRIVTELWSAASLA
jgi:hypothetical protein